LEFKKSSNDVGEFCDGALLDDMVWEHFQVKFPPNGNMIATVQDVDFNWLVYACGPIMNHVKAKAVGSDQEIIVAKLEQPILQIAVKLHENLGAFLVACRTMYNVFVVEVVSQKIEKQWKHNTSKWKQMFDAPVLHVSWSTCGGELYIVTDSNKLYRWRYKGLK
jgi:hypothetical protein